MPYLTYSVSPSSRFWGMGSGTEANYADVTLTVSAYAATGQLGACWDALGALDDAIDRLEDWQAMGLRVAGILRQSAGTGRDDRTKGMFARITYLMTVGQ